MTSRRNFLGLIGAGAALPALDAPFAGNDSLRPLNADFDMSWVDRMTKPHKVVIDSPAISDGGALYRSVMLRDQYTQVFGTFPDQFSSVLVIRHEAIPLAMNHSYWERFPIGEEADMKDRDGNWIKRNPIGPAAGGRASRRRSTPCRGSWSRAASCSPATSPSSSWCRSSAPKGSRRRPRARRRSST
jgi:hypothetical protein